jgi:hypothetical protein
MMLGEVPIRVASSPSSEPNDNGISSCDGEVFVRLANGPNARRGTYPVHAVRDGQFSRRARNSSGGSGGLKK